jgi:hypothetical protein
VNLIGNREEKIMSSTNRSEARNEHIADYYKTPIDKITEFLHAFIQHEPNSMGGSILDPCAGGIKNNIEHTMSYPEALINFGVSESNIHTIDIRENSRASVIGNYLDMELDYKPKTIITNPPFIVAQEIIEKALHDVEDGGFVIMLLRLNFLGGKKRKEFWDKHMPKYSFVHNRRMSFTNDARTDSIEYAHFVWQKGLLPEFTLTKII